MTRVTISNAANLDHNSIELNPKCILNPTQPNLSKKPKSLLPLMFLSCCHLSQLFSRSLFSCPPPFSAYLLSPPFLSLPLLSKISHVATLSCRSSTMFLSLSSPLSPTTLFFGCLSPSPTTCLSCSLSFSFIASLSLSSAAF